MNKPLFPPYEPLPGAQVGAKLCLTFAYAWKAILKQNHPQAAWETLNKYPLRPRVLWRFWQDAEQIVGTRFGSMAQHGLIDVDARGGNHPDQNPTALTEIRHALESIGICRTVLTRSSHSGGLHLWIPLPTAVPTFWFATTLKVCLEQHGFDIRQGQLEVFPNCKAYARPGETTEYQGHRLPLQPASGAALLDDDRNIIADCGLAGLEQFFARWDHAAAGQDMSLLQATVALARDVRSRRRFRSISVVIAEWRKDLETELWEGWTGHGQTNHLLKTIACYAVVFLGLRGEALVEHIIRTAPEMNGYAEYCGHQHDLCERAQHWAKTVDGYYWALGTTPTRETSRAANAIAPFNGNQRRADDAKQRIISAVETLTHAGALPVGVRQRMDALAATAKCSKQTLQKLRHLWEPEHQAERGDDHTSPLLTPETGQAVLAASGVCTADREHDRGDIELKAEKSVKGQNSLPVGVVHTFDDQMKGVSRFEAAPETSSNSYPPRRKRLRSTESVTLAGGFGEPLSTAEQGNPPIGNVETGTSPSQPTTAGRKSLTRRGASENGKQTNGHTASRTAPCEQSDDGPVAAVPGQPQTGTSLRESERVIQLAPGVELIRPARTVPEIEPGRVKEVADEIRLVLSQIQSVIHWGPTELQRWIEANFDGRRRSQLQDVELPLLLAKLQQHWEGIQAGH